MHLHLPPEMLPGAPRAAEGKGCVLVGEGWDPAVGVCCAQHCDEVAQVLSFTPGTASGSSSP